MEYLLIAVILYFILRTAGNLVGLLTGAEAGSSGEVRTGQTDSSEKWEGPSPRQHTGAAREKPTFWGEDIEDATWYEVDEGSRPRSAMH